MRLIDAEALMKKIKEEITITEKEGEGIICSTIAFVLSNLLDWVEEAPTIEAKPVVHAHWENIIIGFFSCSHCGNSTRNNMSDHKEQTALFNDKFGMTAFAYCPHCGAQMDEKEGE